MRCYTWCAHELFGKNFKSRPTVLIKFLELKTLLQRSRSLQCNKVASIEKQSCKLETSAENVTQQGVLWRSNCKKLD